MKKRNYKIRNSILCACMMLIGIAGVSAQNVKVYVYLKDGTVHDFVTSILNFNDGILEIPQDWNAAQFEIGTIRKLTFEEITSTMQITENNNTRLFPNPAQNFIQFSGTGSTVFAIYSLDGKMMLSGTCSNNDLVDVSSLPKGFYLTKINNSIIKFVKL